MNKQLKLGDEFESGIITCMMSGYHHYKVMKSWYSPEFVESISKLYESKYDNWMDETFVVIEMNMIERGETDLTKQKTHSMVVAMSELCSNSTEDRFGLDLRID